MVQQHDDRRDDQGYAGDDDQVKSAVTKGVALVVAIALVIAVGTILMVRGLGLGADTSAGTGGSDPVEAPTPLPSTALPVPSDSSDPTMSTGPSSSASPGSGDIKLNVSPTQARPMERINLTGDYPGNDNVTLEVQRYADGAWTNFGVQAPVRVGTYSTYVMTGRSGENRFRVFDPASGKGSNVVLVTIG
ncbi:MAG: hypothetical protein JWR42_1111 [Marmoricola sp.]|nr:hypothetical protein [Marmoricola sp.]